MIKYLLFLVLTTISCLGLTPDEVKFFETKIRPALSQNCYKCHSKDSEKVKGGLLLDNRANLIKGGDSGPSLNLKDPNNSLLLKSLTYKDDDLQMPPSGKLPDNIIKDFEAWSKMGFPDPREGVVQKAEGKSDVVSKNHWAYQSISKQEAPKIKSKWVNNEIDSFVFKKLEENKLTPSEQADKKTLIRRVYYDLIGLPPTEKEVEDFVKDKSSDAYEKLIDKLLASNQYGVRWGRYWLDTSRYSDTTGTVNGNQENRYTYAYTYRNYVIRSFNEDKPFNKFIIEQIAADKIPNIKSENLAALGFLTLGKNSGNNNDTIDDRIDAITKGFMATTVVCARCHDHKFDPVTAKDYYALHGILNSSYTPEDALKPLLSPIKETPEYKDYLINRVQIEKNIEVFINTNYVNAFKDFSTNTAKWLYGGYLLNNVAQSNRQDYIRTNTLNPRMIQRWTQAIKVTVPVSRRVDIRGKNNQATAKVEHPAFLPYAKMFNVSEKEFGVKFREMVYQNANDIDPFLLARIRAIPIASMRDLGIAYQNAVIDSLKYPNSPLFLAVYKNNGPLDLTRDNFQRFYSDNGKTMNYDNRLRTERGKITSHEIKHPAAPARAMAILDKEKAANSYVFLKGDPNSRGPNVERRFIEFINRVNPNTFTNGSGRLELAWAVASPNNPLTSRVIVNRIWAHHFGEGFVKTPDDFGTQSEKPANQELLDWLSIYFMENNWSIKKVHKLILTSSTYKQTSLENPKKAAIDPYNKYLWRMNIIRLDFESLRDTVLYVGGKLDNTPINQPEDLFTPDGDSYSDIRSIYGLIDRNRLPETLTTFDFATPEMTTGKRFQTTVPKQALFLMNNALVVEQVRNVVARKEFISIAENEGKVKSLYDIFYQRDPSETEIKIALRYIEGALNEDIVDSTKGVDPKAKKLNRELSAWERYAHILMMSNEMVFIN